MHTEEAIATLVDVAQGGREDAARVSAANALLYRGYGRSLIVPKEHFEIPPEVIELTSPK